MSMVYKESIFCSASSSDLIKWRSR